MFEREQIIRNAPTPRDRSAITETEESNRQDDRGRTKLIIACYVCTFFMLMEFVGGYLAQSLAIMSDAFSMTVYLITLIVSLRAAILSTKGIRYHRAELIGALFSISSLWIVTFSLMIECTKRLMEPSLNEYLIARLMATIASVGIFFNLVLVFVLYGPGIFKRGHTHRHGHIQSHGVGAAGHDEADHEGGHGHGHSDASESHPSDRASSNAASGDDEPSINLKAAMMHTVGNIVQSAGVLVSAVIIKIFPDWKIIDPIITLCFAFMVIFTTGFVAD